MRASRALLAAAGLALLAACAGDPARLTAPDAPARHDIGWVGSGNRTSESDGGWSGSGNITTTSNTTPADSANQRGTWIGSGN